MINKKKAIEKKYPILENKKYLTLFFKLKSIDNKYSKTHFTSIKANKRPKKTVKFVNVFEKEG